MLKPILRLCPFSGLSWGPELSNAPDFFLALLVRIDHDHGDMIFSIR